MKIVKYLNHMGVDSMLKSALGDDLTVFRFNDSTGWITRDQMDFDYVDGNIVDQDWDVFIFDDMNTIRDYLAQPVRAQHHVWYCHGTFSAWPGAQQYFNKHFTDIPVSVIFTDEYKRTMVDQWREFPVVHVTVCPVALNNHKYTASVEKNSRCFTVGNNYNGVCRVYPRYQTVARPGILELMKRYPTQFDAFGWNGLEDGEIFGDFRRSSAPIPSLAPWSASIHLSGVASIGVALAECFAAAIPVLATPKYQLPHDGSWIEIQTVDQMISAVDDLLSNPARALELGKAGQQMFRQNFSIENYRQHLIEWLGQL
jgi:hypothetical protein